MCTNQIENLYTNIQKGPRKAGADTACAQALRTGHQGRRATFDLRHLAGTTTVASALFGRALAGGTHLHVSGSRANEAKRTHQGGDAHRNGILSHHVLQFEIVGTQQNNYLEASELQLLFTLSEKPTLRRMLYTGFT